MLLAVRSDRPGRAVEGFLLDPGLCGPWAGEAVPHPGVPPGGGQVSYPYPWG